MTAPIPKAMLAKLIEAGAVRRLQLTYVGEGWVITAQTQNGEEVLRQSIGTGPRVFKTLDGAIAVITDMGARFLDVDLGPRPPRRPSRRQATLTV